MKKFAMYLWCVSVLLCARVPYAFASLEITEIMYAPADGASYEWVEIQNTGSESIDLASYRFFHGDTSGPLTLRKGSSTVLAPSAYTLIVKSSSSYEWVPSGSAFSASTLSLPDSGDNTFIALSNASKTLLDSVTYDTTRGGSKASGTSLSKVDGVWIGAAPTPGQANSSSGNEESGNSLDVDTTPPTEEEKKDILITHTKIVAPRKVLQHIAFEMYPRTTTSEKDTLNVGVFVWNFGDGMSETRTTSDSFTYSYAYPGEYVVTLSFKHSILSDIPDATDRMVISVVSPDIRISSVGSSNDPYIEIENSASSEISLSLWILRAGEKEFIIPEYTFLLPKKKLKVSSHITHFTLSDIGSIVLLSPSREVLASYPVSSQSRTYTPPVVRSTSSPRESSTRTISPQAEKGSVIDLNTVGQASAVGAGSDMSLRQVGPWIGLVGVVCLGWYAMYLMRVSQKKNTDELEASDIDIIE